MSKRTRAPLSIIIPAYNEGESIKDVLAEIEDKVKTPHDTFIIYDFDNDSTIPPAEAFIRSCDGIALVKNKYGAGALNAIKTGFDAAPGEVLLVVMADLSDELAIVDRMFKKAKEGNEIVCASRYAKGGAQIGGPRFKRLLSRTAGISLHYITRIPARDATNSFKMYTRKILDNISIESRGGFELGMEIVVKAHLGGFEIAEIPTTWRARKAGKSRFRFWKWTPGYIRWYLYAVKGMFARPLKAKQE